MAQPPRHRPGERRDRERGGDHHRRAPGSRPRRGGRDADVREGVGAVALAAHARDGPEADDRSLVHAQWAHHPAQEQERGRPGGPGRSGGARARHLEGRLGVGVPHRPWTRRTGRRRHPAGPVRQARYLHHGRARVHEGRGEQDPDVPGRAGDLRARGQGLRAREELDVQRHARHGGRGAAAVARPRRRRARQRAGGRPHPDPGRSRARDHALRVRSPRGGPAPDGRGPPGAGGAGAGAPRQVDPGPPVDRRRPGAGHAAQLNRSVGIIGPGRAGVGLGLALAGAGYAVELHGRTRKAVPRPLTLTVGPGDQPPPWIAQPAVVILAVRDDAIRSLAGALADAGAIRADQVVLHLSGVHGQEALGPLVGSRAALGSLHPLQTISDPERAAERLKGAWAAVEGMPRAVEAAERLAQDVGLRPFRIASQAKPMYHAGAVFASNYFVVVEAVAQRLLRHAGLTDAEAWQALRPLVEGTLENLLHEQPKDALTGPVARGDDATIRRHLASLTKDDALLYLALGRAALELAEKRGMDEATAARVADALATDLPLVLRPGAGT